MLNLTLIKLFQEISDLGYQTNWQAGSRFWCIDTQHSSSYRAQIQDFGSTARRNYFKIVFFLNHSRSTRLETATRNINLNKNSVQTGMRTWLSYVENKFGLSHRKHKCDVKSFTSRWRFDRMGDNENFPISSVFTCEVESNTQDEKHSDLHSDTLKGNDFSKLAGPAIRRGRANGTLPPRFFVLFCRLKQTC